MPQSTPTHSSAGSFLRAYWLSPDDDRTNHVILRTAEGLILLNAYPYANGHLLVALGEARPTLHEYTAIERAALWRLVDLAAAIMERALSPQGINIGINQGRAAGAGVPEHLHAHLVPRWSGDVNFMSVVGHIRVIPAPLEAMAARYARTIEAMRQNWPSELPPITGPASAAPGAE
ncbi:MAG: HIT domain-containing protein [Phycisphaeraceae bacterium]|nr:HIT domain-containing protein [Phycisphaeraceae bacterium]